MEVGLASSDWITGTVFRSGEVPWVVLSRVELYIRGGVLVRGLIFLCRSCRYDLIINDCIDLTVVLLLDRKCLRVSCMVWVNNLRLGVI